MAVETEQPTRLDELNSKRSLLFGVAIWFIDQNLAYFLSSLACKWSWFPFHLGPLSGLQVVETLVTLLALALMLYVIYLPWRSWRKYQTEAPPGNPHMLADTEKESRSLLAFIAMAVNGFFALFIIATFVVIFGLRVCVQG